MTQRTVRTEHDRAQLLTLLKERKLPFVVSVAKGEKRSHRQNRLQQQWMRDAEDQGDMTAEEYRGLCKLTCGVPILRAENEHFRKRYDEVVKPLPYEQKLAFMQEPLDLPVTRMMTVSQHTRYLDAVQRLLAGQGIKLTEPDAI
jgi:hypothetical protein